MLPALLSDVNTRGSSASNQKNNYLPEFIITTKLKVYSVGNIPIFMTRTKEKGSIYKPREYSYEWVCLKLEVTPMTRIISGGKCKMERVIKNPRRTDFDSNVSNPSNNMARVKVISKTNVYTASWSIRTLARMRRSKSSSTGKNKRSTRHTKMH